MKKANLQSSHSIQYIITIIANLFQVESEGMRLDFVCGLNSSYCAKWLIHCEKIIKKEARNQVMNEKYLIEKLGCGVPGSKWRPPDYETDALTN